MYTTLISTQQLTDRMAHTSEDLMVLDCRFNLSSPQTGRIAYGEGHIPGAQYADLNTDLSGPQFTGDGRFCGRNPLPDAETLARKFCQWGVHPRSQIVAYDASDGVFAARLWWLARWLGHTHVAVLDGQYQAWVADTGPLCTEPCAKAAGDFTPGPSLVQSVTAHAVARTLGTHPQQLVDARPAERFAGLNETLDARAGHIPGATSRPYKANLDSTGRFKSADELRTEWRATVADPATSIVYCGSGGAACQSLLAMEIAGLGGAALYPGSWSEWSSDINRPAEL